MKTTQVKSTAIVASLMIAFGALQPIYASVSYNKDEYQLLVNRAAQKTWVRVMVTLDVDVPLLSPDKQSTTTLTQLANAEKALLAELGSDALKTGQWKNGLGQMGIYVKSTAFPKLATSKNIRNFSQDTTDNLRLGVYNGDGRLDRIEAEIDKSGYADVEVTLNLANLDFEIDSHGATRHKPTVAQQTEVQAKLPSLLTSLSGVTSASVTAFNSSILTAAKNSTAPSLTIRIDREGFLLLREHSDVRGLRLVNDNYAIPFQVDPDALSEANKNGYAIVRVELRRPAVYSTNKGKIPDSAWQSQENALRKALVEIFAKQASGSVKTARDLSAFGGASMRITAEALQKINANPDPRLRSITLVKSDVKPMLAVSVPLVNMTSYHNMGYSGAGQTIAIFDSGVEKDHPFLQNGSGTTKVTFEACYSTQGGPYVSLCPSPNANGDSPLGMSRSAVPGSLCRANDSTSECSHGTHVAGIAAGRNWNGLIGMAPEASIMAVQIDSYVNGTLSILDADVEAAAHTLASNIPASGGEYTVNLSIGSYTLHQPSCPAATTSGISSIFEDAVSTLTSLRVPVVAATGNQGTANMLAWPACTPKVIKVGATIRDAVNFGGGILYPADRFWPMSNIASPISNYLINEVELLAPGSYITSSTLITNGVATSSSLQGTSMAAPHVAGLYAVVKSAFPGISVANASAWIVGSASIWTDTSAGYQVKRIHLP